MDITKKLVSVASGREKAELVIKGGTLINVYTGEVLPRTDVAIAAGRVAYVGPDASHTTGPRTKVINAEGLHISPGFIDAHTHLDIYCTPTEFARVFITHGTTTIFSECIELASVLGYAGVKLFMREAKSLPLKVYTLIPMCSAQDLALSSSHSLTLEEVGEGLKDNRVKGLGEVVSWPRVLSLDEDYFSKMALAKRAGKRIEGHSPGARGWKLVAYSASGITSCHESINGDDTMERLRLGMWAMIRYGGVRKDLKTAIRPLLDDKLKARRAVLVSDSTDPREALKFGHMDEVVRQAIREGLDPTTSIQMVTLNPAEHFGMEAEIGGVAPGRSADILLIDDTERVGIRGVIIDGRLVARDGKLLIPLRSFPYPRYALNSVRLRPLRPEAFRVHAEGVSVRVRVMELVNEHISREVVQEMPVVDGQVVPDADILKVAVIDRHWNTGRMALGFLKGFGSRVGAVASTLNFDENNLVVLGARDDDMALAVNELIRSQGGIIVVDGGRVLAHLPLPYAGVCSLRPIRETAKILDKIISILKASGSPFENPLIAILFLTFVTLPALKISDRGLVDVRNRKFVPLIVEDNT